MEDFLNLSEYYEVKARLAKQRINRTDTSKYHFVSDTNKLDYFVYRMILQILHRIRYTKYGIDTSGLIISSRELYILNQWIYISDHNERLKNTITDEYYLNQLINLLNEVMFNEKDSKKPKSKINYW